MNDNVSNPTTAVASRTLITAGFTITNSRRQPTHIEIHCERPDMFGSVVHYLVVICDGENPPQSDLPNIRKEAEQLKRTLVFVCKSGGSSWISWQDFLESLGGAVPGWRALGSDYASILSESAANKVPAGLSGEAWQIFEDTVADGFEFILGNRVNRLGGKKRGKRVSDMVTQTPDRHVLVLDAKASASPYVTTWDALRPLMEYTKAQITRQRGHFEVCGAILVAKDYAQKEETLKKYADDFLCDVRVPLTFLRVEELVFLISTFSQEPTLRTSVNWTRIFCRGGVLSHQQISSEIDGARTERYVRGDPLKS